jgi:hypothetical protein
MGHRNRTRVCFALLSKLGETIYQGSEIGTGIAEEVFEASISQQLEVALGGILNRYGFLHGSSSIDRSKMTYQFHMNNSFSNTSASLLSGLFNGRLLE